MHLFDNFKNKNKQISVLSILKYFILIMFFVVFNNVNFNVRVAAADEIEELDASGVHVAYYSTLQNAFDNASSGNTIQLLSSISECYVFNVDTFTLDLNGYTISCSDSDVELREDPNNGGVTLYAISNADTLTIVGEGEINVTLEYDSYYSLDEGTEVFARVMGITANNDVTIDGNITINVNASDSYDDSENDGDEGDSYEERPNYVYGIYTDGGYLRFKSGIISVTNYEGSGVEDLDNTYAMYAVDAITIIGIDDGSVSSVNPKINGRVYVSSSNNYFYDGVINKVNASTLCNEEGTSCADVFEFNDDVEAIEYPGSFYLIQFVEAIEELTSSGVHVAYYSKLQNAFSDASSGNTLKLLMDINEYDAALASGTSFTLDLNGYDIIGNGSGIATIIMNTSTTLIVIGQGEISAVSGLAGPFFDSGGTVVLGVEDGVVNDYPVLSGFNDGFDGLIRFYDGKINGSVSDYTFSGVENGYVLAEENGYVYLSSSFSYVVEELDESGVHVAYYETIAEALNNFETWNTLKIFKDISLSSPITIGDVKMTLDLNGKTISSSSGGVIVNNGNLTITGGGKLTSNVSVSGLFSVKVIDSSNTLTLEGVTIESVTFGFGTYGINSTANLTVKNTTINIDANRDAYGIYFSGETAELENANITVESASSYSAYGVYTCGGTFVIKSGTISADTGVTGDSFGVYSELNDTYSSQDIILGFSDNKTIISTPFISGGYSGLYVESTDFHVDYEDGTVKGGETNCSTSGLLSGFSSISCSEVFSGILIGMSVVDGDDGAYVTGPIEEVDSRGNFVSYYGSLNNIFSRATSGNTLRLIADSNSSYNCNVTLGAGKEFTLDLNGHSIKCNTSNSINFLNVSGTLTIQDSVGGGILNFETTADPGSGVAAVKVNDGGKLTLISGTISGKDVSTSFYPTTVYPIYAVHNLGTFNMLGGNVYSFRMNGSVAVHNESSSATFAMISGEVKAEAKYFNSYGILNVDFASVEMNGGYVFSEVKEKYTSSDSDSFACGVCNNVGTFIMNDGEIHSSVAYKYSYGIYNTDTFIMNNGSVSSTSKGTYAYGVDNQGAFTINGGEISVSASSGKSYGIKTSAYSTTNIIGGTITATKSGGSDVYGIYGVISSSANSSVITIGVDDDVVSKDSPIINGGVYDSNTSWYKFFDGVINKGASTYTCESSSGSGKCYNVFSETASGYSLVDDGEKAFLNMSIEIVDSNYNHITSYEYLQYAFDNVGEGEIVRLLSDVYECGVYVYEQEVVFDLNGNNLYCEYSSSDSDDNQLYAIENDGGVLTIIGSGTISVRFTYDSFHSSEGEEDYIGVANGILNHSGDLIIDGATIDVYANDPIDDGEEEDGGSMYEAPNYVHGIQLYSGTVEFRSGTINVINYEANETEIDKLRTEAILASQIDENSIIIGVDDGFISQDNPQINGIVSVHPYNDNYFYDGIINKANTSSVCNAGAISCSAMFGTKADYSEVVESSESFYLKSVYAVGELDSSGNQIRGYNTLSEAFNGVSNGNTLKLLRDVNECNLLVESGRTFILDTGGSVISCSGVGGSAIINNGTLTIKGNGFIEINGGTGVSINDVNYGINNTGTLILESSTIRLKENAEWMQFVLVLNTGDFRMNGGTLSGSDGYFLTGIQNELGSVQINDGIIDMQGGNVSVGIYSSASLEINNGSFTVAYNGNEVKIIQATADIVINGGTFITGTGASEAYIIDSSKDVTINGGTFTSNCGSEAGVAYGIHADNVIMSGGEITVTNTDGWSSLAIQVNNSFVITGGIVRAVIGGVNNYSSTETAVFAPNVTIGVKDGNVNGDSPLIYGTISNVNEINFYDGKIYNSCKGADEENSNCLNLKNFIYDKEELSTVEETDGYIYLEVPSAVEYNSSGEFVNSYDTLSAAFSGASNGSVIKLMENINECAISVPAITVTLDLNGYVISCTSNSKGIILNGSNFTLQDSRGTGKISLTNTGYVDLYGIYYKTIGSSATINSGKIEVISTKDDACGIYAWRGSLNINGGVIYVSGRNNIYGANVTGDGSSFDMEDGEITSIGYMTSGSTLKATNAYGVYLSTDNKSTMKNGRIILGNAYYQYSFYVASGDTLVVGVKDGIVSQENPYLGGFIENGFSDSYLEFYDGVIDLTDVNNGIYSCNSSKCTSRNLVVEDGYIWSEDRDYAYLSIADAIQELTSSGSHVKYYDSLYTALSGVASGNVLKVIDGSNGGYTEVPTLASGKTVTLDLNGQTIKNKVGIINNGSLTLVGNGVIEIIEKDREFAAIENNGELVINGATIITKNIYEYAVGENSGDIYYGDIRTILNNGTLTFNSGLIENSEGATKGVIIAVENRGTFTMNGGVVRVTTEFDSTSLLGIFNIGQGSVFNMNGGEVIAISSSSTSARGIYISGRSTISTSKMNAGKIIATNTSTGDAEGLSFDFASLLVYGGVEINVSAAQGEAIGISTGVFSVDGNPYVGELFIYDAKVVVNGLQAIGIHNVGISTDIVDIDLVVNGVESAIGMYNRYGYTEYCGGGDSCTQHYLLAWIDFNGGVIDVTSTDGSAYGFYGETHTTNTEGRSYFVMRGGELKVTSSLENSYGVYSKAYSSTSIEGGRLEALSTNGIVYGIYLENKNGTSSQHKGVLTIGKNDASLSTESPNIIGGIYATGLTYTEAGFYDGLIDGGINDYVCKAGTTTGCAELFETIADSAYIVEQNNTAYLRVANVYEVDEEGNIVDGYDSLQEAIDNWGGSPIIRLGVDVNECVSIDSSKSFTLDLNGKNITCTISDGNAVTTVSNSGNVTITGNGTIVSNGIPEGEYYRHIGVYNDGTLVIDGANISVTGSKYFAYGVVNHGNFTLDDGNISVYGDADTSAGIFDFYDCQTYVTGGVIDVTGTSLLKESYGMLVGGQNTGMAIMEGGLIKSNNVGVKTTGEFALHGGKIEVVRDDEEDGLLKEAIGLYIDSMSTDWISMYDGTIVVTNTYGGYTYGVYNNGSFNISRGEIRSNSTENYAFGAYGIYVGVDSVNTIIGEPSSDDGELYIDSPIIEGGLFVEHTESTVSFYDGTIYRGSGDYLCKFGEGSTGCANVVDNIEGGSTWIEDSESAFISNFAVIELDSNGNTVTTYEDFSSAMSGYTSGNTLKLYVDVDGYNYSVASSKTLIIDLNGRTISKSGSLSSNPKMFTVSGNLTLKDSKGGGRVSISTTYSSTSVYGLYSATSGAVITVENVDITVSTTSTSTSSSYSSYGIYISSGATANVNGGTISVTDYRYAYGVYVTGTSTKYNQSGGDVIATSTSGYAYGVYAYGIVTVTGGSITGTNSSSGYTVYGVYNRGNSTSYITTFGVNDGVVSKTSPVINGGIYVYSTSAKLYFYDGIIKKGYNSYTCNSSSTKCSSQFDAVETGYSWVDDGSEAYLGVLIEVVNGSGEHVAYHSTLSAAFSSEVSGNTIKLLENISECNVSLAYEETLTLDLNGHSITCSTSSTGTPVLSISGNLTIMDSVGEGAINLSTSTYNGYGIFINLGGVVTLNSGTISTISSYSSTTSSRCAYGVYNYGTITVNGGKIYSQQYYYAYGVYIRDGTAKLVLNGGEIEAKSTNNYSYGVYNASSGSTIEMTGGKIISSASSYSYGVYNYNTGAIFTMNDGEISSETTSSTNSYGVYNAATFTMNGGTIFSKTKSSYSYGVYNTGTYVQSGGNITANAASGSVYGLYAYGSTNTITGGSITGTNSASGYTVYGIYNSGSSTSYITTIGVNDGVASKTSPVINGGIYVYSTSAKLYFYDGIIKSGYNSYTCNSSSTKCSSQFDAIETGYSWVDDGSEAYLSIVIEEVNGSGEHVAYHGTLQSAFSSGVNGNTIKLLENVIECDITIASGKTLTLDLNGKSVTCTTSSSTKVLNITGNLTIMDSVGEGSINLNTSASSQYGVYINAGGGVTLNSGTINSISSYSSLSYSGYGIYNLGTLNVNGGKIYSERPYNIHGVYNAGASTFVLSGGEIEAKAITSYAYGVSIYESATVEMTNGSIKVNANIYSYGVYTGSSEFTMDGGSISSTATTNTSYGVYCASTSAIYIQSGGSVTGTASTGSAYGLYVLDGVSTITGGSITGTNTASGYTAYGAYYYCNSDACKATFGVNDGVVSKTSPEINGGVSVLLPGSADLYFYDGIIKSGYNSYTCNNNGTNVKCSTIFDAVETGYSFVDDGSEAYLGIVIEEVNGSGEHVAYHSTLNIAFSSGVNGNTIKLLENVIECDITLASGKTLTLDLNGKSLTCNSSGVNTRILNISGSLVIQDSVGEGIVGLNMSTYGGAGIYVSAGGIVTLNGGIINSISTYNNNNSTTMNHGVYVLGTFNMNGGKIYSQQYYYSYGVYVYDSSARFVMNDGEIEVKTTNSSAYGINFLGQSQGEMNGGTVKVNASQYSYGVFVNSGATFTLNGGTISSTATQNYSYGVHNTGTYVQSGGNVTATASTGSVYGLYANVGVNTIVGGSITGTNSASGYTVYGVYIRGSSSSDIVTFGVNDGVVSKTSPEINGGIYVYSVTAYIYFYDGIIKKGYNNYTCTSSTSKCSSYFDAVEAGYSWIDDGSEAYLGIVIEEVNGSGEHVAYHSTLSAAFSSGVNGNTIKLLENVIECDITLASGKVLTLDMNDKKIICKKTTTQTVKGIINNGTLTIVGNGDLEVDQSYDSYNGTIGYVYGVYNTGTLVIDGLNILTRSQDPYNDSGTSYSESDNYIYGIYSNGILDFVSGSVDLEWYGPTYQGDFMFYGLYSAGTSSSSIVNIGKSGDMISVTSPEINSGVYIGNTAAVLNFYDGIINSGYNSYACVSGSSCSTYFDSIEEGASWAGSSSSAYLSGSIQEETSGGTVLGFYGSLQAAFNGVANGNTIKLLATVSSCAILEEGKVATLNLNGFDINCNIANENEEIIAIENNGDLTIVGTGNVYSQNGIWNKGTLLINDANTKIEISSGVGGTGVKNEGTFTFKNGQIVAATGYGEVIGVETLADFVMDGGSISASAVGGTSYGVVVSGRSEATINGGSINVSLSASNSGVAFGIFIEEYSSVTLNGGEVNAQSSDDGEIYGINNLLGSLILDMGDDKIIVNGTGNSIGIFNHYSSHLEIKSGIIDVTVNATTTKRAVGVTNEADAIVSGGEIKVTSNQRAMGIYNTSNIISYSGGKINVTGTGTTSIHGIMNDGGNVDVNGGEITVTGLQTITYGIATEPGDGTSVIDGVTIKLNGAHERAIFNSGETELKGANVTYTSISLYLIENTQGTLTVKEGSYNGGIFSRGGVLVIGEKGGELSQEVPYFEGELYKSSNDAIIKFYDGKIKGVCKNSGGIVACQTIIDEVEEETMIVEENGYIYLDRAYVVEVSSEGEIVRYYGTLQSAFSNATSGNALKLLENLEECGVQLTSSNTLTLDLNGYNLSGTSGCTSAITIIQGNLTIKGEGEIIVENLRGEAVSGIHVVSGEFIMDGPTIRVNASGEAYGINGTNGNVTINDGSVFVVSSDSNAYGVRALEVYINGGEINVSGSFSEGVGASSKLVIESGKIIVDSEEISYGILNAGAGVVEINGGEITVDGSATYGVYNVASQIIMEEGVFNIGGINGYGIYNYANRVVEINGGRINLEGTGELYGIYNAGQLNITGGLINVVGNSGYNAYGINNVAGGSAEIEGAEIKVSGGKYSFGIEAPSENTIVNDTTMNISGVERAYGIRTGTSGELKIDGGEIVVSASVYAYGVYTQAIAIIDSLVIKIESEGTVYGITLGSQSEVQANGVEIKVEGSTSYGIDSSNHLILTDSMINVLSNGDGAFGIRSVGELEVSGGEIEVRGKGNAYGIYGYANNSIEGNVNIVVASEEGFSCGIYTNGTSTIEEVNINAESIGKESYGINNAGELIINSVVIQTSNQSGQAVGVYNVGNLEIKEVQIVVEGISYYAFGISNSGQLTIRDGVISAASEDGSAYGIYGDGTVLMEGGVISATSMGIARGVLSSGEFILQGGSISAVSASEASGIYTSGTLTVGAKEGLINDELPFINGGIYILSGANVSFYDGRIHGSSYTCKSSSGVVGCALLISEVEEGASWIDDGRVAYIAKIVAREETVSGEVVREYASLQTAINTASNGNIIRMLGNVKECVLVEKGQILTIELNGYGIKCVIDSEITSVVRNEGTLVIQGTGLIEAESEVKEVVGISNAGVIVLMGGNISVVSASQKVKGIYVESGKVTINGAIVNVSSTNEEAVGVVIEEGAEADVILGVISVVSNVAEGVGIINKGSLLVQGGAISVTGEEGKLVGISNESVLAINGGVVNVVSESGETIGLTNYMGEARIEGGVISSNRGYALEARDGEVIYIEGRLQGSSQNKYTYSMSNVSFLEGNNSEWTELSEDGSMYVTIKVADAIKIGTRTYSKLKNAIASATAGDVININSNITSEAIEISKKVTIKTNGYTINNYIYSVTNMAKEDYSFINVIGGELVIEEQGSIESDVLAINSVAGVEVTINGGRIVSKDSKIIEVKNKDLYVKEGNYIEYREEDERYIMEIKEGSKINENGGLTYKVGVDSSKVVIEIVSTIAMGTGDTLSIYLRSIDEYEYSMSCKVDGSNKNKVVCESEVGEYFAYVYNMTYEKEMLIVYEDVEDTKKVAKEILRKDLKITPNLVGEGGEAEEIVSVEGAYSIISDGEILLIDLYGTDLSNVEIDVDKLKESLFGVQYSNVFAELILGFGKTDATCGGGILTCMELSVVGDYYIDYPSSKGYDLKVLVYDYTPKLVEEVEELENSVECEQGNACNIESLSFVDFMGRELETETIVMRDGEVVEAIDTREVGRYTIVSKATDMFGYESKEIVREVTIVDKEAPVVKVSKIEGKVGQEIDLLKVVEASDNNDRELKIEIIDSNVDVNNVGEYMVGYRVIDSSGNETIVYNEVIVKDINLVNIYHVIMGVVLAFIVGLIGCVFVKKRYTF